MLMRNPFVPPSLPVLRQAPPDGPSWIHELKFDGFRVQLHKRGREAVIYSRNGHDFTSRYPGIQQMLLALPRRSLVIDAELVACAADGTPDFVGLVKRNNADICVWAFDLLDINGESMRARPLLSRRQRLETLVTAAASCRLRFSESFVDGARLLAVAENAGLEGIVSKRVDQAYRPGKNPQWVKVKTQAWKTSNRWRRELFGGE